MLFDWSGPKGMTALHIFLALDTLVTLAAAVTGRDDVDAGSATTTGAAAPRGPTLPPPLTPPRLLAPNSDAAGSPPPDDYQLRRANDGSGDLIYEASGFTARIARDGSVSFRDRHVSKLSLIPFLPGPPPTGVPTLQSTLRGLGKHRHKGRTEPPRDPTADETLDPSTTVSRYRPDPREACQYPRPCFFDAPVTLLGARARFDLTDELMRFAGQDPYRYGKARFLAATHEMRVRMAARAHAEDLSRSRADLPALLRSIACDDRLRPGERRAIIEALRAELDLATPASHAPAEEIRRFLDELDRHDGGARCPVP
ncbi:MAG TPA: hypothetical protein VFH68_15685 [Polyangia bacterium]|jgi:hypothetical protein|nr:hypothetical protein [Polyangia bacterium]